MILDIARKLRKNTTRTDEEHTVLFLINTCSYISECIIDESKHHIDSNQCMVAIGDYITSFNETKRSFNTGSFIVLKIRRDILGKMRDDTATVEDFAILELIRAFSCIQRAIDNHRDKESEYYLDKRMTIEMIRLYLDVFNKTEDYYVYVNGLDDTSNDKKEIN